MKIVFTLFRYLAAFLVLGLVLGGVFYIKSIQLAPTPPPVFPPEAITSELVQHRDWQQYLSAVGEVRPRKGVRVSAELAGTVSRIAFESGQTVKQGDVLVELDRSVEEAELKSAQASLRLSQINLKRARELRAGNTIAQSELDVAEASADEAAARVAVLEAAIAKKVIRAPFDGRLGIRAVNLGEYLNAGAEVVNLQDLSVVDVYFSLPQRYLSLLATSQKVMIQADAYQGEVFEGELTAIEPAVNSSARMVEALATLVNPDISLRPGMFVDVRVVLPSEKAVVAVPRPAVYSQSYGSSIFVVVSDDEGGKIVEERIIRLGESRGDYVEIIGELAAGEEVATSGIFKLSNGRAVMVQNHMALNFSENPTPGDS